MLREQRGAERCQRRPHFSFSEELLTRFLWLALACLVPAQGAVVYSNGGPTADIAVSLTYATGGTLFSLPGTVTVAGIRFWIVGLDADPSTSFSGDVYYALHVNNVANVGTKLFDGTVSGLTSTATGIASQNGVGGVHMVEFNLPTPMALGPGGFWLVLHEGTSLSTYDGTELAWQSSGAGYSLEGNIGTLPDVGTNQAAAFELVNTPFSTSTPEPATVGLTGVALVAAAAVRRWTRP